MANKRKFENDINDDNVQTEDHNWKEKPMKLNPTKHTLDSDEEDNDDEGKAYILDDEAIEGQEDGIAGMEGDIQITPFNMKEEMEEGHFDTDGMYHWKKEKQIRDNWLENIDWVKIKPKNDVAPGTSLENEEDSNDLSLGLAQQFDDISVYSEMLGLMRPKETVAKALQRISGPRKNLSSAERWKRKKAGIEMTKEEEDSKQKVSKLTELANRILQNTGNMDVYQESYEFISEKVQSAKIKNSAVMEPELDMYADDFDSKEKERLVTKVDPEPACEAAKAPLDSGVIRWEFKWTKDSTEVSGPHSSEEMLKWTKDGRFSKEVWVKKCGQDGDFYTSKRIDFDLFI